MGQQGLNKKKLNKKCLVVGILAGKGGVGKSTLTAELARAFNQTGKTVGVLDGDLYGPSLRHLLPEDTLPKSDGELVVPAKSSGIEVMSLAYFPKGKGPAIMRAPIASQIIRQFIEEVQWGDLDVLLVDFPPGTGDIQISLMQKLSFDGALAITTPQELSLLDVRKAMEMCLPMGVPLLGVVENMSFFLRPDTKEKHYLFGKGGGALLAEEFSLPILSEIPIDPGLGQPKTNETPNLLFEALAKKILFELKGEKRCKIIHEDRYHFSIVWSDGKKSFYRFSDLQSFCPCIECLQKKGEEKGQALEAEGEKLVSVGNYGIQVVFSHGCSKGIYPFSLLKRYR